MTSTGLTYHHRRTLNVERFECRSARLLLVYLLSWLEDMYIVYIILNEGNTQSNRFIMRILVELVIVDTGTMMITICV